ncbi:TetR/AcrR family transcriptional regulator [Streptomyces johnsoniae]|uniref:TetR/AcrR family transcriptional regulator n=1 Tax=Streptomyces johnsoniae TaxID=3075532 RepID=A0ABU2RX56_9ACTN|nr:TetR/AcrR family transcriptional regulator [Streptomyces sp. DSM 41886]MDT0441313.1 TetR/AcrR family transcriptional regulator [Streptomyces sp. DSM 41886]
MAGLRERKKQQTRTHISDVATGLFLERGFDAVTVAEVAEAADVSVNTVYNYFPAKEDLFLDREEEVVERPSERVRSRAPGESAPEAVLRGLRTDIEERQPWAGLGEGYERFVSVAFSAPTLTARLIHMMYRTQQRLAETLAEEAGDPAGDHRAEFIAGQLMAVQGAVYRTAGQCALDAWSVEETARLMLEKLALAETLLSPEVRDYARRPVAG